MTRTHDTTARTQAASTATRLELVITRVLDAPQALVFQAWTERERVLRWFGPKDFTTLLFESDPRPGGAWRARMRSPEGEEYAQHGIAREIVPPERFVFSFVWDHEPEHEMLVTITLAERGGKTAMTFRQGPFESEQDRQGHESGWNESFDRLADYLAETQGR